MGDFYGMEIVLADTDTEFRPYLEEIARRGRLVMRRCASCGLLRYPPGAACPWCMSLEGDWAEVSGRGTIYSYEVVTQAILPGLAVNVPYVVALIELDEQRGAPEPENGLRIVANIVGPDGSPEAEENVGIGARVEVVLVDLAPDAKLPQFQLAGGEQQAVWRYPG